MTKNIVFIHGMFQNGVSWSKWTEFFEQADYNCVAPCWPLHDGQPAHLRTAIPEGLGRLTLDDVVGRFDDLCRSYDEPPIVIGHSVGGLVAQILTSRGLTSGAVCISSVAPNDIIALDWNLLRNVVSITNPLKGHQPYEMTPDGFHAGFCNTMTRDASDEAYRRTATHDSRQVMRDCLGTPGHIDLSAPHAPLLFIAGDSDNVIPSALCRRNAEHYVDKGSVTSFHEFLRRGHFICGEPGWEEVASMALSWIEQNASVAAHMHRSFGAR